MDYKKIAECVRLCGSTPKIHECQEKCSYYCGRDMNKCIPRMTSDAATAIEKLLETVEAMKNPHIKIQIDYEELTIKEVCDRLEQLKKRAEAAESRVRELESNRPVQADGDVFELAEKLAKVTAERDKAVEQLHKLASYHGACAGCKRLNKECSDMCICEIDGEDHWEWDGLDG